MISPREGWVWRETSKSLTHLKGEEAEEEEDGQQQEWVGENDRFWPQNEMVLGGGGYGKRGVGTPTDEWQSSDHPIPPGVSKLVIHPWATARRGASAGREGALGPR